MWVGVWWREGERLNELVVWVEGGWDVCIFADLLISICRWSYSIVGVALGVTFGWRGAFGWGWSIGCGSYMLTMSYLPSQRSLSPVNPLRPSCLSIKRRREAGTCKTWLDA